MCLSGARLHIAKIVSFMTDMPEHVAGMTINRWCGSSMQAIHSAAGSIAMNAGKVFIVVVSSR